MRRSKSVGFSAICLGIVLMIGAALLPVSPATQRFGPFQVHVRGDNCGPAGYVAFRDTNSVCRASAHRRLVVTTGVGLLVLALGMALFAGGDDRRRSMVDVGSPVARRRSARRGPRRSSWGPTAPVEAAEGTGDRHGAHRLQNGS